MVKVFSFKGLEEEAIKRLSLNEFAALVPSRERRSIKRGFTDQQKTLLKKIESKNNVETHCRDMVVIPVMLGKTIRVHSGKEFIPVRIDLNMLGHRLGEFVLTRRRVAHSNPGVGATRSSASASVR